MYNLYIDPFLLACPQSEEGIEEFENYINSLTLWGEEVEKIKETRLASVYVSARMLEILVKTNGYPDWDKLEKIIKNLGMQEVVHPHDILVLIDGFLKFPCVEDRLRINEILIDNVQYEPSCYLAGRADIFIEHYHRLAILMCLLCNFEELEEKAQIMLTRHREEDITKITLRGEIVDCEFCEASQTINLPYYVDVCFNSCITQNSLYLTFDALNVWFNADSEKIYKQAITIYIYQINCQLEKPKSKNELSSWSFGRQFLKTARGLDFLNDQIKIKMLLRACAETILEENLSDTHWLRTGKGANNPQKKRRKDKAEAWRRDIDRDYHLHYWKTANGTEFASVVVHDDMAIPE